MSNIVYIRGPHLRSEVIGALRQLSDQEYQLTKWADPNYPHAFWDSLLLCIYDTLFDVNEFHQNARKQIGVSLYDEEEADMIGKYCEYFLDLVDERIGGDKPDSAYINHPEWSNIVEGAKGIYELMERKNEQFGYEDFLDKIDSGEIKLNELFKEE
jgi:hypothetical protein